MANSTTHLDLISVSQATKEATDNALADAMSANALFGRRASTTAVLTWGYYGGPYRKADGTLIAVANGTVALTDAATNYILETDGVVSKVTVSPAGWPAPLAAGANALYAVVCSGGDVTGYTDYRIPGLGGAISVVAADVGITDAGTYFTGTDVEAALQELGAAIAAPAAGDVTIADAGTYFTGTDVEAALQEIGADIAALGSTPPVVAGFFFPGSPTASQLMFVFPAPAGITTITFAAAIAGSSGKAFTAATAQTDLDVRKNATTAANGTSVGTIRFAAAGTVPTFIAASGFSLTGGTDYLSVWAPGTPDATLADISAALYGTR
jgi:hypothetical protein